MICCMAWRSSGVSSVDGSGWPSISEIAFRAVPCGKSCEFNGCPLDKIDQHCEIQHV